MMDFLDVCIPTTLDNGSVLYHNHYLVVVIGTGIRI